MPDSPSTLTTTDRAARRPFVLVTGLSGAGRGTALAALEDMGYVAVDNVPLPLLGDLMRSTAGSPGELAAPLAFGVDTRTFGFDPHDLVRRMHELRRRPDITARLLFLDCDSETLLRRYTESRRPHPLAPDRPVKDGIGEERKHLGWVRDSSDIVIDTSALSPHAFKQPLAGHFALERSLATRLAVMSFSYRRGLPREADLVFDVRFLKNPHWVPALRPQTGRDPAVAAYIRRQPVARATIKRLVSLLRWMVPLYVQEGKSYLTVAIGCTGGRHRSVYVAEALKRELAAVKGVAARVAHRDLAKGPR